MMYVIQTKTGCELTSGEALKRLGYDAKTPERMLNIRNKGVWHLQRSLVFTGYIFLDSPKPIKPEDYYRIKNTDGVINFIGQGKPLEMSEAERQYINWLWNGGKPIEPSKVFVTVDGRKMIMSGPLRKYNGEFASIDIRQRRARVNIPICGVYHKVTLPIEVL